MSFRADLHMHSHFSDGICSPSQLIQLAQQNHVQAISITDHDTLGAYPQAIEIGQQHGVEVIPGIELSTHFQDVTVHVLGYSFDLDNPQLQSTCQTLCEARLQRIEKILERLQKRNIQLTLEDLNEHYGHGQLGRPHIAHLMVKKNYVTNVEEAFNYYLGDKQMGGLKLKTLETEEAIALLHQAGGYAVLAHPHLIKQKKKLRQILALGFDGIEAYYANYQQKVEYFIDYAQQNQMFYTGGSDFHQPKPYQSLGCAFTTEAVFKLLKQRTNQHLNSQSA